MFSSRSDAGRRLAEELQPFADRSDVVVLALPRGGVPVALPVAAALGAPLDVILVRKLGLPDRPEVAMGAIGEGGVRVVDTGTVRFGGVSRRELTVVEEREREELDRRADCYRAGRERVSLEGQVAVIIDDGIATGSTAKAACRVARANGAKQIVLAVPVAPAGWERRFGDVADVLISLECPHDFYGVGQAYVDFSQTSDEEVIDCLDRARAMQRSGSDNDR